MEENKNIKSYVIMNFSLIIINFLIFVIVGNLLIDYADIIFDLVNLNYKNINLSEILFFMLPLLTSIIITFLIQRRLINKSVSFDIINTISKVLIVIIIIIISRIPLLLKEEAQLFGYSFFSLIPCIMLLIIFIIIVFLISKKMTIYILQKDSKLRKENLIIKRMLHVMLIIFLILIVIGIIKPQGKYFGDFLFEKGAHPQLDINLYDDGTFYVYASLDDEHGGSQYYGTYKNYGILVLNYETQIINDDDFYIDDYSELTYLGDNLYEEKIKKKGYGIIIGNRLISIINPTGILKK